MLKMTAYEKENIKLYCEVTKTTSIIGFKRVRGSNQLRFYIVAPQHIKIEKQEIVDHENNNRF